jgi:small subunit ribosomal protein S6
MFMRAYELMVIIDSDVDDAGVNAVVSRVGELITADGGTFTTDMWGRRRYAYPINHKLEGIYAVFEISTPASNLEELDRFLRLADDVVRHKIIRLPDAEAQRRGLLGAPATAGAGD